MPLKHPNAGTILICGLLGLLLCAPFGVVAWVMGHRAMKQIDFSGVQYSNRGTVQAGMVCGIIATVIWGALLLFGVVL